jgi:hypothetical protein
VTVVLPAPFSPIRRFARRVQLEAHIVESVRSAPGYRKLTWRSSSRAGWAAAQECAGVGTDPRLHLKTRTGRPDTGLPLTLKLIRTPSIRLRLRESSRQKCQIAHRESAMQCAV